MTEGTLRLQDIVGVEDFQKVQDDLAKSVDMALLTVDYKGIPVTAHSRCTAYCTYMRNTPEYSNLCQKCDSRGGVEAARLQEPYIYLCHRGIVDLAIPITANGHYLGAVMAGQVRIADEEALEYIVSNPTRHRVGTSQTQLDADYFNLPVMSFEKIEAIGNALFSITNILVERALLRWGMETAPQRKTASDTMSKPAIRGPVELPCQSIEDCVLPIPEIPAAYAFLNPALTFLHTHIDRRTHLSEMAALCNVSDSHFGKSFAAALKMGFSAYQNTLKLAYAEQLLMDTDKTVNQISEALGFENPSYFIRIFKRQFRITPGAYRHAYVEKLQVESAPFSPSFVEASAAGTPAGPKRHSGASQLR